MKLTKEQLNKIIHEEMEKSLDEVDLRGFMKKGMEKLKSPFQRLAKYKGDVEFPAGAEPSKKVEKQPQDMKGPEVDPRRLRFDALNSLDDILKTASPELKKILSTPEGERLIHKLKVGINKSTKRKIDLLEQELFDGDDLFGDIEVPEDEDNIFLTHMIKDVFKEPQNKAQKIELLDLLIKWTDSNLGLFVNSASLKSELVDLKDEPGADLDFDIDIEEPKVEEPKPEAPVTQATTQAQQIDPETVVSKAKTPTNLVPFNTEQLQFALQQYRNDYDLRKILQGPENTTKFITSLVKRGLLFPRPLSVQEQKKIWQDYSDAFKTIKGLKSTRDFKIFAKQIAEETEFKIEAVIAALISLWKQGKLARPYDPVDVSPERRDGAYPDPADISLLEETRRLRKLAGILKD